MKRYQNSVHGAEKGITLLPTVSAGEYAEVLSVYTDKYGNKAVVPQGWTVSGVSKENIIWGKDKGLVIYHIPKEKVIFNWKNSDEVETLMITYDQFVWTPVRLLTANGTIDGIHFNKKFGRMNYRNDDFSKRGYHDEPLAGGLLRQKRSVDKYGGYYSSRYNISQDYKTGKPMSVKGAEPWTKIDFLTAKEVSSTMIESKIVTSHLTYGAEYDTQKKWAIESGTVTIREITVDSTELGNYHNNKNYPIRMVETGEDGCINNIYGFAGNVFEWTQERDKVVYNPVVRNGSFHKNGNWCPVDSRWGSYSENYYDDVGFRTTLCIK